MNIFFRGKEKIGKESVRLRRGVLKRDVNMRLEWVVGEKIWGRHVLHKSLGRRKY